MANLDRKLDEILQLLSSQKADISNLPEHLRQNCKAVSTEVKRIKEGAD